MNLSVNNDCLKMVHRCKCSGVIMDDSLNDVNILNILTLCIKTVSIFYNVQEHMPLKVFGMLAVFFLHSHILYGIEKCSKVSSSC